MFDKKSQIKLLNFCRQTNWVILTKKYEHFSSIRTVSLSVLEINMLNSWRVEDKKYIKKRQGDFKEFEKIC